MVEGRSPRPVLRVGRAGPLREKASLPEEAVVRILLNGKRLATLAATPLALDELALGHLALEGRLREHADVRKVRVLRWRGEFHVAVEARRRSPQKAAPRLSTSPRLSALQIRALMRALLDGAALYREGGGVHTSALASPDAIHFLAADIGKVNTLDRLAGQTLLAGQPRRGSVLLTTGRLTGAMAERALRMGCPVWISHSGPTTRALDLAKTRRATLIGYARGGSFAVYSGGARVKRL